MVPKIPKTERGSRGKEHISWILGFTLLSVVIPGAIIVVLPSGERSAAIATLSASPFIEFLAVSVGIGLGLDPILSFFLTVLPCIGICMLMVGVLGFLGDSSKRVRRFLDKVQKRVEKYPRLKRYGVISGFFLVMLTGVYIAPGISIILGWSRVRSVVFMAGGISFITLLIGLGTVGLIDLLFV